MKRGYFSQRGVHYSQGGGTFHEERVHFSQGRCTFHEEGVHFTRRGCTFHGYTFHKEGVYFSWVHFSQGGGTLVTKRGYTFRVEVFIKVRRCCC